MPPRRSLSRDRVHHRRKQRHTRTTTHDTSTQRALQAIGVRDGTLRNLIRDASGGHMRLSTDPRLTQIVRRILRQRLNQLVHACFQGLRQHRVRHGEDAGEDGHYLREADAEAALRSLDTPEARTAFLAGGTPPSSHGGTLMSAAAAQPQLDSPAANHHPSTSSSSSYTVVSEPLLMLHAGAADHADGGDDARW